MECMFRDVVPTDDQVIQATIEGNIPEWLHGDLIRIGPGKWDLAANFTVNHWFDGCAMLFKFSIHPDGSVSYRSRYAQTTAYEKMTAVGRPVLTEFGTAAHQDPTQGLFSRLVNKLLAGDLTDNVVGNLFMLGKDLYAVTETCYAWKVDPETLKTVQKVDMHKTSRANLFCPHPMVDRCGTFWNIGSSFFTGLKYHLIKIVQQNALTLNNNVEDVKGDAISPFDHVTHVTSWPARHKTSLNYFHSFAMTENYIIFIEQPLLINMTTLMTIRIKKRPMRDAFEWLPNERTRFHLIDKKTGHLIHTLYEAKDPLFILHTLNAFEENSAIFLDSIAYKSDKVFDKFYIKNLRRGDWGSDEEPAPRRYVLPLPDHKPTLSKQEQNLDNVPYKPIDHGWQLSSIDLGPPGLEMATINPSQMGLKYRYFYASGVFEEKQYENSLLKVDLNTKTVVAEWSGGVSQHYPGEPFFIPRPGAEQEDDGVLLSVVAEISEPKHSFLLFLDAASMRELARARVPPSVQVPLTFHGVFLPTCTHH